MRGVLLLAHGTPDSLADMPEFLTRVRGGLPPSAELIKEMRQNYSAIGGRSPLTDITREQARALEAQLGGLIPVYVGMRNWHPLIAEALDVARSEGIRDLLAIPMAPQYSALSVGKYRAAVGDGVPDGIRVRFVETWYDHPRLLDAFVEKVENSLKSSPDAVAFTAHSLPIRVVREGDPYPEQVAAIARRIAERVSLPSYHLAYQSAGRTPEPWLGPPLEDLLRSLAYSQVRSVLVVPVSFVCDHTEILFDIDVKAKGVARSLGLDLLRTDSLNTSETFIRALTDIVRLNGF